jgi:hypothetical protein
MHMLVLVRIFLRKAQHFAIFKHFLGMLSSRPNFEILLVLKIRIMCLSPNVFIKFGVERWNTQRWKVRYLCGLNFCFVSLLCMSALVLRSCLRLRNWSVILYVVISGVSTSFGRASCLSGPCESGSWCVQGASSTEHACLQPTSSDCSFEEDLCGFNGLYATITSTNSQSAIIENMPYHDHTFGNCTGNKS